MLRSATALTLSFLASIPLAAADPGQPDPNYWGDGWAELNWGAGTQVTSVDQWGTIDAFYAAGNAGGANGTVVSVSRFDLAGNADGGWGFLGTASFSIPGASAGINVRKVLGAPDGGAVVVGDALFSGTRQVFIARLDIDGVLVPTFGVAGIVITTFGIPSTTAGAAAADASLDLDLSQTSAWISVVGWLEHQTFGRDLGVFGVFSFTDGSLSGAQSSAVPSTGERWLRIADVFGRCGAILGESDGELVVRASLEALPGCINIAPSANFLLELPAAPAAGLRAADLSFISNPTNTGVDLAIAAWVETGLVTRPTAIFRTTGLTDTLRPEWGSSGVAFVDATTAGYNGFRASRIHPDLRSGGESAGVLLAGIEQATGANVDRVRVARVAAPNGTVDPTFPSGGTVGPDTARDHHVRDADLLIGDGVRILAAVTTANPMDLTPRGFLQVNCAARCIFDDGFESGTTSQWSTVGP